MTALPEAKVIYDKHEWRYLIDELHATRWIIMCDSNTRTHCLPRFQDEYLAEEPVMVLEVPPGESNKSLEQSSALWKQLMDATVDRQAILICLGGGMITDLGAFVGSVYKRGIQTILVPTTLLAMTDAAIGGKNGVNFLGLKNQLGTIGEPLAVMIDHRFLDTLPERELRSGFAESIKHALIGDERLWHEMQTMEYGSMASKSDFIKTSIRIKQRIVLKDPLDKGLRQVLNFGHTVGHAIESLSHGADPLLHGECVALGMLAALNLSVSELGFDKNEADKAKIYIQKVFPDIRNRYSSADILEAMKHDKKNRGDQIIFSLLRAVGDPVPSIPVQKEKIIACLEDVFYGST